MQSKIPAHTSTFFAAILSDPVKMPLQLKRAFWEANSQCDMMSIFQMCLQHQMVAYAEVLLLYISPKQDGIYSLQAFLFMYSLLIFFLYPPSSIHSNRVTIDRPKLSENFISQYYLAIYSSIDPNYLPSTDVIDTTC